MSTPSTGYKDNKDERGVEEARVKRAADAQKAKKKRDLMTQLTAIKNFLFSTKSTIEAKQPVLKKKEIEARDIQSKIQTLEGKERVLVQKAQAEEKTMSQLEDEEKKKKLAVAAMSQANVRKDLEKRQVDQRLGLLHAEHESKKADLASFDVSISQMQKAINELMRDLETKKAELAHMSEEKKTKEMSLASVEREEEKLEHAKKEITAHIPEKSVQYQRQDLSRTHGAAERVHRDLKEEQMQVQKIHMEIETKKKDLLSTQQEHDELARQIQQLATDKAKLEGDLKKIEAEIARV